MEDEPIAEVPVDNLGPCMLALNPMQRKFVVGWVGVRGVNAARVARAAGYSEDRARITACEFLRHPGILAALREEADRRLDGLAVVAILEMEDLIRSTDVKVKASAIDSVLDRTGYGRKTTQDIRVQHEDNRSTADLLAAVKQLMGPMAVPSLPVIEGEVVSADG
jgi:phage terminase small subunit